MKTFITGLLFTISLTLTACGGAGGSAAPSSSAATGLNTQAQQGPLTIPKGTRTYKTDALLYEGTGAWQPEVAAIKDILKRNGASYEAVTSSELNELSLDELAQFGAIIWPGGYGNKQTDSLDSATRTNLRRAVQEKGVGWIGFCAGAFVAVNPTPAAGKDPAYGFALVDGPMLKYYYLEEEFVKQGRESEDYTMITHTFADGTKRDIIWYGGPVTPNIPGGVIAKYPNGDPAITQLWSGNGFLILLATHPTVDQSIIDGFGLVDRDGLEQDIAWRLIEGAIKQKELPAF